MADNTIAPASDKAGSADSAEIQKAKERAERRPVRARKPPPVGLVGTMLILATLLMAGATDLFRWLLVVLSIH